MKLLRAVLLVIVVAPALVVVGATQAIACSCVPRQPDGAAVKDAAAVFSGTLSDTEDGVDIGFDRVTWTFAVDTVYKSMDVTESQDVASQTQSAACGLVFKEGKRYVVFAHDSKGKLETNSCMNTRLLAEGKDLKLEPIATFEKTDPMGPKADGGPADESWDPFVVGAIGVLAVAGIVTVAAVVVRRRDA